MEDGWTRKDCFMVKSGYESGDFKNVKWCRRKQVETQNL